MSRDRRREQVVGGSAIILLVGLGVLGGVLLERLRADHQQAAMLSRFEGNLRLHRPEPDQGDRSIDRTPLEGADTAAR
jgi:hypothetical protein